MALEDKWPVLGRQERAASWLRVWTDLGRAPRTIDAYARGLADYLQPSWGYAAGQIVSTEADLKTCAAALGTGTLLSPGHLGATALRRDHRGAGSRDCRSDDFAVPA